MPSTLNRTLSVAFLGNHQPDLPPGVKPWSTESHKTASLEELGHTVIRLQEGDVSWQEVVDTCLGVDVFWWVQTYGLAARWPLDERQAAVEQLNSMLPTISSHLDLWHGLDRSDQLAVEPFFRTRFVFTADGDHDAEWRALNINHRWMPPAVYGAECQPGTPRREYRSEVAFVGSWQHYGHEEWWPHRRAMLQFLQRTYRNRVRFWPRREAIRGQALNDLYQSCKVVVGDSCFADRSSRYFSDRAFETVGRSGGAGALLVMPYIEGLAELLVDGKHCRYYPPGDFGELKRVVDYYLDAAHERERREIVTEGQAHVREYHTYRNRVQAILDTLAAEGAL